MQGLRVRESLREEFAASLVTALRRAGGKKKRLRNSTKNQRTDILRLIADARQTRDDVEALWRCFLAGHFGRTSTDDPEKITSSAKFLCAFGARPYWTWKRCSARQDILKHWLEAQKRELKILQYGNHRKYESKQPETLFLVIDSFLDWVTAHGGNPTKAFVATGKVSPQVRFKELFRRLKEIKRFGRTGAFDLLCLLGDLGILDVRPDSCYVSGSTGPLAGAIKLWKKRAPAELAEIADNTAKAVKISFDVFEDALCMWQKR